MKDTKMFGAVQYSGEPTDNQEFDEQGRGYWMCPGMDEQGGSGEPPPDGDDGDHEIRYPSMKADANLVSSQCQDGQHRPVLDFDFPCRLVPSTHLGHFHLYVDKPMQWETYERLLNALAEAGLLEEGYVGAAINRKATFVRPEWVKKPLMGEDE